MALNSLLCADVPLRTYTLTQFHLISKEVTSLTMLYVSVRSISRLARVNTQSSVGVFHFHDVVHLHGSYSTPST